MCEIAGNLYKFAIGLGNWQAPEEVLQARRGYEPVGVRGRQGLQGIREVVELE